MESDNIFKELEPDANEILFGQRSLPDRPLTTKEASKKKKILLKLVDQKLKFKLVELMKQQVASQHNNDNNQQNSGASTIPFSIQTSNDSHGFGDYQSQSNWPDAGLQHREGYWHSDGSQPFTYPSDYGTIVGTTWNNRQPNVQNNFQYVHQNLSSQDSLKRKHTQNSSLIHPSTVADVRGISNNQTKVSRDVRGEPSTKKYAPRSSLIPIKCTPVPPIVTTDIHRPTKNQLPAATPAVSTVTKPIPKTHQIPQSIHNAKFTTDRPMPRRRRRFGRGRKTTLQQQSQVSAQSGENVILRDKAALSVSTPIGNTPNHGHNFWNEISRLISSIFRKESNQIEPLSSFEEKLQKRVLIEVTTNPDVLRSDRDVSQFLSRIKIEEMISKVKMILQQVQQSNDQVQSDFAQFRDNLIAELSALNEKANDANKTENVQSIHMKINEFIGPLLAADVDDAARNKLVADLVTNPRTLETSEAITKPLPDKVAAMREIKRILDEHMSVRPGKRFYIPMHRTIDVPFVVTVRERSNKISEENLKILHDALIAKMSSVVSLVKPKIIDPKFVDGTLVMVCANRKTFDLIKTTISGGFNGKWTGADLIVTPAQIKNPLARSELKTVRMKFAEPQLYHFNDLMVQLKVDNPSLLTRRWELREPPPGKDIDSTEEIYVGVDMESLGPIEQLDRVGVLLKSTVTFEICYDDSERNYLPDHSLLTK